MFSPQDYEFAARVVGLPVPQTPAERAVAAPMVAQILRNFHRAAPPMPGHEDPSGMNTGATRSLNTYPDVRQPEARVQLGRRLEAGVVSPDDQAELYRLLEIIMSDPMLAQMFSDFIQNIDDDALAGGEYLSQQRPLEYDMPNYGGQYSVLNAPTSSTIPASVRYQELG